MRVDLSPSQDLIVSPHLGFDHAATGITRTFEGLKRSAHYYFNECVKNKTIQPQECAAIIFMCIGKHCFNERRVLNQIAIEMSNMTYHLTSDSCIRVVNLAELDMILESIFEMIEMCNTQWR